MQQLDSWMLGAAINDFGAGHSSLEYLRCLDVDRLKLDKRWLNRSLSGAKPSLRCNAGGAIWHKATPSANQRAPTNFLREQVEIERSSA